MAMRPRHAVSWGPADVPLPSFSNFYYCDATTKPTNPTRGSGPKQAAKRKPPGIKKNYRLVSLYAAVPLAEAKGEKKKCVRSCPV